MSTKSNLMISYAYYSAPWMKRSGDDIRIHFILQNYARHSLVVAYVLGTSKSCNNAIQIADGVVYVTIKRPTYSTLSRLVKWDKHYDLNLLSKLTMYIDELITVHKIKSAQRVYIFGAMTLMPFLLKLLGTKSEIIYDPLANYAQTLYLRSRKSLTQKLKYGLYLALHKLSLKASDAVVYPSEADLTNAKRMFKKELTGKKTSVIPNPYPICYKSVEEYQKLRQTRNVDKPHFILLPGGKGQANRQAVETTLKAFAEVAKQTDNYMLIITGPWKEYANRAPPNTIFTGYVDEDELKRLLAISDVGLAPVFTHAAGTFLKILAYIAAGLDIITTIYGLISLDIKEISIKSRIYLIKDEKDLQEIIKRIIEKSPFLKNPRTPMLCSKGST